MEVPHESRTEEDRSSDTAIISLLMALEDKVKLMTTTSKGIKENLLELRICLSEKTSQPAYEIANDILQQLLNGTADTGDINEGIKHKTVSDVERDLELLKDVVKIAPYMRDLSDEFRNLPVVTGDPAKLSARSSRKRKSNRQILFVVHEKLRVVDWSADRASIHLLTEMEDKVKILAVTSKEIEEDILQLRVCLSIKIHQPAYEISDDILQQLLNDTPNAGGINEGLKHKTLSDIEHHIQLLKDVLDIASHLPDLPDEDT